MALAVKVEAVATPALFVVAVVVADAPNRPLAPAAGAVNVTRAPATGVLKLSATLAAIAVGKAVPIVVVWDVPAEVAMLNAVPALFVRLKLAGVATPPTVAVAV